MNMIKRLTDRQRISALIRERDADAGVLFAAIARLGGLVDGHPTDRINFLQRIDELREIETAYKEKERNR